MGVTSHIAYAALVPIVGCLVTFPMVTSTAAAPPAPVVVATSTPATDPVAAVAPTAASTGTDQADSTVGEAAAAIGRPARPAPTSP